MKNEHIKEIFSWIKWISAAFIFSFIINNYVIVNANVPSGSMTDTIQLESRVVGSRLAYQFSEPERFDVVTFPKPDEEETMLLKRIIGMPGEKLEIKDGKVYINDTICLDEPFLKEVPSGDYGPVFIPDDSYFMMGDNRNDSLDSRYWSDPFVNEDDIVSKIIFSYYPDVKMIK